MPSPVHSMMGACLALLCMVALNAGAALPDGLDEARRSALDAAAQAHEGPLQLVVIDADQRFTAAYNGAGDELDRLYEIGSITKGLTGLLLAEMVGTGEVRLDQPIRELLPGHLRLADPDLGAITLLQLATHHSGLPRLPDNLAPTDPLDPYADYDTAALHLFLRRHQLGEGTDDYLYSNLGVGLLGHLLGETDGRGYAEALRIRVLEPLGMRDSAVLLSEEQSTRLAPMPRRGSRWTFDALAGAGAVVSSARDMERLARALIAPESVPDLAEAIELATRVHARTDEPDGAIGLGWHLKLIGTDPDAAPQRLIWHNGATGSFHAALGVRRDTGEGLIALSNVPPGDFRLAMEMALAPELARPIEEATIELPESALSGFPGRYLAASHGLLIQASIREGRLSLQLAGQAADVVEAVAAHRFVHRGAGAIFEFERHEGQPAHALVLHQHGRQLRLERSERVRDPFGDRSEIVLGAAEIEDYPGRYTLADGTAFEVSRMDGQLLVRLGNQPVLPVFAHARDKFFWQIVDAQLSFERDAQGRVVALVLHQNAMNQRALRQP